MRMTWVAVGDANTCGDCLDRHGTTHTEEDWQLVHGEPRSVLADTACGRRCRCVLVPAAGEAADEKLSRSERAVLDAAIDEVAGKMTGQMQFDLLRGGLRDGAVILREYESTRSLYTVSYADIARIEEKIGRWKIAHDYAALPADVWTGDLTDLERWLDEALR